MRMERHIMSTWPEMMKVLAGFGLSVLGVFTGRLAWHADQVRRGHRRFFSREFMLELPVIAGISLLVWSASEYWGLTPGAAAGIGTLAGWLGPRGIEVVAVSWWKRK